MSTQIDWFRPEPIAAAPTLDLLTVAMHESGHAVAGYWHHNWPFESLELAADGRTGHLSPVGGIRKDPVQYSIACLSGPCAEAKFLGVDWQEIVIAAGASDLAMAKAALARLADPPSLFSVASQTGAILQMKWRSIERVAFELAARRRLSHSEFSRVLARW